MNKINTLFTLIFSTIIAPAHAYLDPGTGSMVISIVVATIATGVYMGKDWFYKIKNRKKK